MTPAAMPRGDIPLTLVARDLHTDIAIPAALVPTALRERWMRLLPAGGAITFGFGQRDFMMSREPGSMEALRALLPSAGVVAVGWLSLPARDAAGAWDVVEFRVDEAAVARLLRHVEAQIGRPVGDRPYAGRNLFDSPRAYSAAFTCNTWTAEALRAAGLPFEPAGVAWASGVMRQAHRIAAAWRAA